MTDCYLCFAFRPPGHRYTPSLTFGKRPNPQPAVAEQRDYYAFYLKKNVVAGSQSATYTLLVPAGSHA